MAYSPPRDPKTGRFIKQSNKSSPSQFKNDNNAMLGIIAGDVASLKVSVMKLTKLFEDEKKSTSIARQRQRTEDYASKYKKSGPTRAEKSVVREEKKSFLDMIKDALSGIFKFALIGLASIGIAKLLNGSGVMETITDFTKKMIIGISEGLQQGMSFISNLLNDPEIISSIFNLAKSVFKFLGDAITAGANFFSNFISDPENQQTLKQIIVAIITGIASAIKAAYTVTKDLLAENSDAIKEGAMSVFLVIKDIIVGALKAGQSALKNADLKKQFVDIGNAIMNLIGELLNMPIFEVAGQKVTLEAVLAGVVVATMALEAGLIYLTGIIMGLGQRTSMGGGGGDYGGGKDDGKGGKGGKPGKPGKGGKGNLFSTGLNLLSGGAASYFAYDALTPEKTDRPTGSSSPTPGQSPAPAPAQPTSPSTSPSRPVNQNPTGMPKSLEEYVDMEYERKKKREGFKTTTYASPEGGNDTVGIGHKLTDKERDAGGVFIGGRLVKVDRTNPMSEQQVKELYRQDIMVHANGAKRQINKLAGQDVWSTLNPMQQYALMDLSFAGGPGLITKDLADAIKSGDMNKASQIIQKKARTYRKNGATVESKHHAKHADLRADIFRGYDPLIGSGSATLASASPNDQRQSKSIPTQAAAGSSPQMQGADAESHVYASGGGGGGEPEKKSQSVMDSFGDSLSAGLTAADKATGGKLGFASQELQSLLRDKSFLEAFQSPTFTDNSKKVNSVDNVAMNEKTPSIYDEVLLSKMSSV